MGIACQACGAKFGEADLAEARGYARCRFCGATTLLPGYSAATAGAAGPAGPRPAVPRPRSITVEDGAYGVRVTRRWFQWFHVALAVFCVVWFALLSVF